MSHLWNDLRGGLRAMRKAKAFTAVALLTLAVGIGANTAMFSVVYSILLKPLPYQDPDRLVFVWHTPPQSSFPGMKIFAASAANYFDWKAQAKSFERMSIQSYASANFSWGGEARSLRGLAVSPDFFALIGVRPQLGRTFAPGEDEPGHNHVVVLSYRLWSSQFGGDRNVVGRTVNVDDVPYTIVGVMGPDFRYPRNAEYWQPLTWTPASRAVRGEHHYTVLARLKPGADLREAQSEMNVISRRLEEAYPADDKGWGARVVGFKEQAVGDTEVALAVLLGAVAFVLLIACANVANLMLGKVLDRRTEIAIRCALGASRARVLRQILVESALLGVAGGVLGAVFAKIAVAGILRYFADYLPRATEIAVDHWALAFTIAISLISGIATGLAPAWRLSNTNTNEALKSSGRGVETGGRRMRSFLVVAEVALALVLLAGAGLLMRTLWALESVNPGFDPHGLVTARISVPSRKFHGPADAVLYFDGVQQRLRQVPGVENAALVDDLPISGGSMQPVALEGHPAVAMADQPEVAVRVASAAYFRTMRIGLVKGREFSEQDRLDRPRVAIVSRSLARKFWPNQEAIGKHVGLSFYQGSPREVIGIVEDVKIDGLDAQADAPTLYYPLAQMDLPQPQFGEFRAPSLAFVARTAVRPESLEHSLETAVRELDPSAAVKDMNTVEDFVTESLGPQRFNILLLGIFAAIALLLAAIGTYSVMAYSVQRRRGEIGVRVALGAASGDILRLVMGEGLKLIASGLAIGLLAAVLLSRLLRTLLFQVGTTDPATFGCVALLLALVGLAACYFPARRAFRIDPVTALRKE